MKGNLFIWRGKERVFDSNWWKAHYEKGLKITKKGTCAYEGEYVHMKGKSKGVWLKLIGCPLRKRLENHQKNNLCFWRGKSSHEGEK